MNKAVFFSIALLTVAGSLGAMQSPFGSFSNNGINLRAAQAAPAPAAQRGCANGVCNLRRPIAQNPAPAVQVQRPVVQQKGCANGVCGLRRPATPAPAQVAVAQAPAQRVVRQGGCQGGRCARGATAKAVVQLKNPAAHAMPKATVVNKVAARTVSCVNGACNVRRPVVRQGGCANGACNVKRTVVKQGGCASGRCGRK